MLKLGYLKFVNRIAIAAIAICAMTATGLFTGNALADFRLCNNTQSLVGVSIGYRTKEGWLTEGWWRVPSNSCASLVEGALTSRYFYVYAEDADQGGQWRGSIFMCTSDKEFKIKGIEDCFARGYERTGYFEVDTGEQSNWMVRLTEAGQTGASEQK